MQSQSERLPYAIGAFFEASGYPVEAAAVHSISKDVGDMYAFVKTWISVVILRRDQKVLISAHQGSVGVIHADIRNSFFRTRTTHDLIQPQ